MHMKEPQPIGIKVKNIMGVSIPEIEQSDGRAEHTDRLLACSPRASRSTTSTTSFTEVHQHVIDVAKREQGLKRLVLEIEKVKRRVNALEYMVMPGMVNQSKYIR